ncbi:DMT family transporter [Agarivorans sp. QJM3NY_25]|uniref:DMT family transporter n=1 Tax=Agarivorans sp. QJM3NY_25 TaxID=3421430 RepID=UPI003D7D9384
MKFTTNNHSTQQQASLAILFASLLWGTTGTAASFAPEVDPLAIGAFAMGFGGLMQAIIARHRLKSDLQQLRTLKKELVLGAFAVALYPLAFYSSMRLAGVAIGTVISIATAPFATVLLECLLSKKNNITKQWLFSFSLGTLGIALLTYAASSSTEFKQANTAKLLGILLGLLAGLSYAIYAWLAKSLIDKGVQSESAIGSLFGLASLLLLPSLLVTGEQLFSSIQNTALACYMALVPMFLGYLAFGFGLRTLHASRATLLTLFEPVVAAVLAVLVVGEQLSLSAWTGMLLISVCLVLQSQSNAPNRGNQQP